MTPIKGKDARIGSAEWNSYTLEERRTLAWRRLHSLAGHDALTKAGVKPSDSVAKLIFMVDYIQKRKGDA
jgi:hypothetical protein